jgi:hypothetical protein
MFDDLVPSNEQVEALGFFARRYGVHWKQQLIDRWVNGRDLLEPNGEVLRSLRPFGGYWLAQFHLPPQYLGGKS